MIDSPFFGSPTKLFEYMALGKPVIASDLEQIGEVLSPALAADEFVTSSVPPEGKRAVLCRPGDSQQLAETICALSERPELAAVLGANARQALLSEYTWKRHVERLVEFLAQGTASSNRSDPRSPSVSHVAARTDAAAPDEPAPRPYKEEVRRQWDFDPCGSHYVSGQAHDLAWFREAERYRYQEYAPWMPDVMEFDNWRGRRVLEIGGGMGTDLAQFAANGAWTTDCDLSSGHLALARQNFALRGLDGAFIHGDAEMLPFSSDSFDLVYTNGVIHHTPAINRAVSEINRVLRPGGLAIVMVYAEHSLHYWRMLVGDLGLKSNLLEELSIGEIMSRHVELSTTDARPLVRVYSSKALRRLFSDFERITLTKQQFTATERPPSLHRLSPQLLSRIMGWNLVIKAHKREGP